MIILICIILFFVCLSGLCDDLDHEAERRNDYRTAERRHQENLKALKSKKKVTRTVARDACGRFIAQETVEGYDDDIEVE